MSTSVSNPVSMEGYMQKRTQTGLVKSLKLRWYVLQDGALRCYQNKDTYLQNSDEFQDRLPVCNVQTVRPASENCGVEMVTQQKVIILVALSTEEQQQWIKAIYEMMKETRCQQRSESSPTSSKEPTRKRSSTGPKFINRIISDIRSKRKSTGEAPTHQSQCYVHQKHSGQSLESSSEAGVRANVPVLQSENFQEDDEFANDDDDDDDAFDTSENPEPSTAANSGTIENALTVTVRDDATTMSMPGAESSVESETMDDYSYDCLTTPFQDVVLEPNEQEAALEQSDQEDDQNFEEHGMQELESMLRDSMVLDEGQDATVISLDSDDNYDDTDTSSTGDNSTDGTSAFEELQQLLQDN